MVTITEKNQYDLTCSDCGVGHCKIQSYGPIVPAGEMGAFCENCFSVRTAEYYTRYKKWEEPRPLRKRYRYGVHMLCFLGIHAREKVPFIQKKPQLIGDQCPFSPTEVQKGHITCARKGCIAERFVFREKIREKWSAWKRLSKRRGQTIFLLLTEIN